MDRLNNKVEQIDNKNEEKLKEVRIITDGLEDRVLNFWVKNLKNIENKMTN